MQNDKNILKRIQLAMPGKNLDPVVASDTITREILDNVYEKLFQYEGLNLVPVLAEELWTEKKQIYRIKLHDNVYFHDGTILNSLVVRRNICRMLKKSKRAQIFLNGILNEEGIFCLEENILEFVLEKPTEVFTALLAMQEGAIVSTNLLDNGNELREKAIGTGPFVLKSLDWENERIELLKNERYWGKTGNIQKVEIVVEKSYQKRKEMMEKGEADIVELQASKLRDFNSKNNIVFDVFPSLDIILFTFNCNRYPMNNINLRKRIRNSFDCDLFLEKGRCNLGERIFAAVPNGVLGHISSIAKEKEADSIPFICDRTVKILTIEGLEDADIAVEMMGKCLENVGIKYDIVKLPFRQYSDEQDAGNYDISFLSWAPDVVSPLAYLNDFYHSRGEVSQIVGLKDVNLDRRIDEIRNKDTDVSEIEQIQRLGEKHCPYLWLYQGKGLKVHSSRIYNVSHNVLDGDYSFKYIKKE